MQNQPQGAMPNIVDNHSGWYPRWPLLAVFSCAVVIGIGMLLWNPLICAVRPVQAQPFICGLPGLPLLQIVLIWLLFGAFWLLFILLGVPQVELPHRGSNQGGQWLERLTRFDSLSNLLYLQGGVALLMANALWWGNISSPISFAFLSLSVFLAHCNYFYRIEPQRRRTSLISYALIAVGYFIVQFLLRRDLLPSSTAQTPLLLVELLLLITGVVAIRFRQRQPAQQTIQQGRDEFIDQMATPAMVLRGLWPLSRLWPVHPPAGNIPPDADDDDEDLTNLGNQPRGNPDPGIL